MFVSIPKARRHPLVSETSAYLLPFAFRYDHPAARIQSQARSKQQYANSRVASTSSHHRWCRFRHWPVLVWMVSRRVSIRSSFPYANFCHQDWLQSRHPLDRAHALGPCNRIRHHVNLFAVPELPHRLISNVCCVSHRCKHIPEISGRRWFSPVCYPNDPGHGGM